MESLHLSAEIKTERLILRRQHPEFAAVMFATVDADRERLGRFLPWVALTLTQEDQLNYLRYAQSAWDEKKEFDFAMFGQDGEYLGNIGCHHVVWSQDCCEIGYWIKKDAEGKGLLTEAAKALMNELFRVGFVRVELRCAPYNMRSAQVARRLGFQLEGHLRSQMVENGVRRDSLVFAKLAYDGQNPMAQRPSCIGHYSQFVEEDHSHYRGSDELLSIGCPVGKKLGLERIGIHIETLLPGRRTSWPHAESDEEEFAYVLSGTPSVWIDGHLYELVVGDFVAFPAGTGISHTFINNSEHTCMLLVGGERTKKENKIIYPLHSARNQLMKEEGSFWDNAPKQELGMHDGLPNARRLLKD